MEFHERVLTFFVFGPCVSENDPPQKKRKTCHSQPPANPQPPKKAHLAHALLAGWTEIKVQLDFTCEVTDPTGHWTKFPIVHYTPLKRTANLCVYPWNMIGKMKTYEFSGILGKYTPKTNTSPPKNRGVPLGISFFLGGKAPIFRCELAVSFRESPTFLLNLGPSGYPHLVGSLVTFPEICSKRCSQGRWSDWGRSIISSSLCITVYANRYMYCM